MDRIFLKLESFYKSIIKPRLIKRYKDSVRLIQLFTPIVALIVGIYWSNGFTDSPASAVFSGIIGVLIVYLIEYVMMLVSFITSDMKKITEANRQYGRNYNKNVQLGENYFQVLYDPIAVRKSQNLTLSVIDSPKSFYTPPFLIRTHYIEILDAFSNEYIENFLCYRLDDYEYNECDDSLTLYTSRMYCFDNLVTNFAMDFRIGKVVNNRKLYEYRPVLTPLSQSDLGNQIGINALVTLRDDTLLLPIRSWNSTISKNKLTSSIAMAPEASASRALKGSDFGLPIIVNGLVNRLGLEEEYAKGCIGNAVFLGFGRVINWGGKPQFYYYVELDIDTLEFLQHSELVNYQGRVIDENREVLFCKSMRGTSEDTCVIGHLDTRILLLKSSIHLRYSKYKLEESLIANLYHVKNSHMEFKYPNWLTELLLNQ